MGTRWGYSGRNFAPAGESSFTPMATGTVVDGVLGTFDPTLLLNDLYTVRLTVVDDDGVSESVEKPVTITGCNDCGT